jgi:hypothetical protein
VLCRAGDPSIRREELFQRHPRAEAHATVGADAVLSV